MAEYGSGIFYGRSNRSQSLTNISQIGILSLPPELDVGPPLTPLSLKIEDDVPKDIILLAEFSEIEGPIPLVSIPENCPKETNLNDVVLQLMSTDYHSLGRSDFQIQKDVCLLQEDPEKGHFIYVHYFTLYDVRARGFVRPTCLAYITREHKKLKLYFKSIRDEFHKVTDYLRICNLQIFISELETRIEDLNFTKERYIHVYQNIQKNVTKNVEEGKADSNLNNTGLEKRRRSISLTGDPPPIYNPRRIIKLVDNKLTDSQTSHGGCGPNVTSLQAINYCTPFLENVSEVDNVLSSSLPLNSSLNNLKAHAMGYSPDVQKLAFHIRSQYKPSITTLSSHSDSTLRGSSKELEVSSSSDSSNGTVMSANEQGTATGVLVSSLLHDTSAHNKVVGSNEELTFLQHTSLDALALQLIDCRYILDIVKKYVGKSKTVREMEQLLADIKSKPQSPLYSKMEELGLLNRSNECGKGPSIFVISLMRRNFRNMRSIRSLCGVGYVACISELLGVFKRFSRSTLTLMFENLDQELYDNPFTSLFVGNMPIINIGGEIKGTNVVPRAEKLTLQDCGWNEDLVQLLEVDLSKVPAPTNGNVDAAKDNFDRDDVAVADDCLEVFNQDNLTPSDTDRKSISSVSQTSEEYNVASEFENFMPLKSNNVLIKGPSFHSTPLRSTSSDSSWASSTPRDLNMMEEMESEVEEDGEEEEVISDIVDKKIVRITQYDINKRMALGKLYHTTTFIQQFSGVSQCIVHSVLSGKPMIVAGPEYLKSVVVLYTKTLSTILPIKPNEFMPVLKWQTGTINPHHLEKYKIIGVCIPERLHVQDLMSNATLNQVTVLNIETGHISGVAYSGSLLHKADQFSRRHFRSDISLQTALQSILMTLGMKVFLHFHLKKTTNRSSNEILKAIGVPRGDWLMIQHLSKLVEDQIRDVRV